MGHYTLVIHSASKFTEHGTVTLEVGHETHGSASWVVFRVIDTGIGMTSDQMTNLFQAFSQVDTPTTRKEGGTGLGLAICKRFSEMLGGDVMVASEYGKGTTFTVRLPAEVPAVIAAMSTPSPSGVDTTAITVSLPVTGLASVASDAVTVLVIDDERDARDLLQHLLSKEGYRAVTAASGEEGLRLARQLHPDAITLDVMMPGMDGWTVLAKLKADPQLCDIPVIMITIVDRCEMGYALGAADYLTKPIDSGRLAALLKKYRCERPPCLILLVEDDRPTRDLIRRALEKEGWQVEEAEDGRVALNRIMQRAPRLIILDLLMPEMDGFQFLDELRRHETWRRIPVIVVTAKDLTEADRRRLNGYVQQILQKGPYTREQLTSEIRSAVRVAARETPV